MTEIGLMLIGLTKFLGTWQHRVDIVISKFRDDKLTEHNYETAKGDVLNEVRILKLINHPNLVQVTIAMN